VLREVEESGRVEVWYMLYADACSSCYLRTGELAYRDAGLTALAQGENTYPMSSRIRFRHGLFLEVIEEPELARRKLMEAREVAERIVAGAEGSESVDEAKLILEAATRRLGRHPSRTTPSEEVPVGDRGSSGGQGEPVSTGAQISPRVGS
jgi:hypothetical protein